MRRLPTAHSIPSHEAGEEQETHLAPLNTKGNIGRVASAAPWPCPTPTKRNSFSADCARDSVPGFLLEWSGHARYGDHGDFQPTRLVWRAAPTVHSAHVSTCKGLLGHAWIWVVQSVLVVPVQLQVWRGAETLSKLPLHTWVCSCLKTSHWGSISAHGSGPRTDRRKKHIQDR